MERVSTTGRRAVPRRDDLLVACATFFAVAVLVHNFDHLRRGGDAVPADVFWVGTLAVVDEVTVVALAFLRHALAPVVAVVSGVALAAGYLFVHFTPSRSWLSDSFVSGHASPLSIAAASLETVAAVVLAVGGYSVLRQGGSGSGRGRLTHPVVVAMVVGNAVVIAGSLASR